MVWATSNKSNQSIKLLVDQILMNGKMTRQEHLLLTSAILADDKITDEERRHINRVLDYLQTGRLKLAN